MLHRAASSVRVTPDHVFAQANGRERRAGTSHDVLLVSMPYASVERPSLALGTLAAALDREAISTRTIHANLMFAERIGRVAYEGLNNSDITVQLGEWTFSEAAFGAAVRDVDAYVAGLRQVGYPAPGLKESLLQARAVATAFIDDLAQLIVEARPRIVGCSSVFQQHCASLALLRRVQALDPSIVTMLGGANCEAAMGRATHRHYRWVDYVASGEADKLLPDLCRLIFAHGRGAPTELLPYGVFGPASRDAADDSGSETREAPRVLVTDLDELPIPNFDDYFEQLELSPLRDHIIPGLTLETSRGCWWGAKHHCTFCGLNGAGMGFRAKSQERVQEEVRWLAERYGLKKFMTVDNILDNHYFSRMLPAFAEQGDMLFFYETKANLNRAQVELLARAGVRWIQPGIEALHNELLALIEKGCSVAINVQLLKWAYNSGIWVIWNHLHGAPGDKPEWYEQIADWLPLIVHLQPPTSGSLTPIRYDRFSPYFNKAQSYGLKLKPYWAYSYAYPVDQQALMEQAYFFCHDGPPAPRPVRLAQAMSEWAKLFYRQRNSSAELPRRSETAPVLMITDNGATIAIRDTRPCAVAPHHELSVLESQICRACDSARSAATLVEALRRDGSDESECTIAAARQRLVNWKIVADFDGKLLCLATTDHPVPYASFEDFAGGLMLILGRRRRSRPADPWQTQIRDMFMATQTAAERPAAPLSQGGMQ
ncbi:MAG: RiPP maturation radical SAM C-methyltransferase [Xanthobacteraceae bacterium]